MPLLDLEAATAARQCAELLQEALNGLTERQRVIVLCRQKRTVRETASDLECSPTAIHDEYHAALAAMRSYMEDRMVFDISHLF